MSAAQKQLAQLETKLNDLSAEANQAKSDRDRLLQERKVIVVCFCISTSRIIM